MSNLRAVLFDLDGTLRDSRPAINPAIEHALKVHDIDVDPSEIAPHLHSLAAVHAALAPDAVSYEALEKSYDEKLLERLHEIAVYEHVPETLGWLRARGFQLAIVSSARRARDALRKDGLLEYFDVVIGGYDVPKGHLKPHPAPVLSALGQLACDPDAAIMVGDLAADIVSARTAVLAATVGVTHGFGTREVLVEAGADYIIDSMVDLPKIVRYIEQNY